MSAALSPSEQRHRQLRRLRGIAEGSQQAPTPETVRAAYPISGPLRRKLARVEDMARDVPGRTVYTVGHARLGWDAWLELLVPASGRYRVTHVADLRSLPHSKAQHFCREELQAALREEGIGYTWCGDELGGLPRERRLYRNGEPDYEAVRRTPRYRQGLARLVTLIAREEAVCLLGTPLEAGRCHRKHLVGVDLRGYGVLVRHIHPGVV